MTTPSDLQLQATRQARTNLLSRVRTMRAELFHRSEPVKALGDEARAIRDDILSLRHLASLPDDLIQPATDAAEFIQIWSGERSGDTRELLLTLYHILELQLEALL